MMLAATEGERIKGRPCRTIRETILVGLLLIKIKIDTRSKVNNEIKCEANAHERCRTTNKKG